MDNIKVVTSIDVPPIGAPSPQEVLEQRMAEAAARMEAAALVMEQAAAEVQTAATETRTFNERAAPLLERLEASDADSPPKTRGE